MDFRIKTSNNGSEVISLNGNEQIKAIANPNLRSIFSKIDNGDGIASAQEIAAIGNFMGEFFTSHGMIAERHLVRAAQMPGEEIIKMLIDNDVQKQNFMGLPTTGENFGGHIKLINPNNVVNILKSYYSASNYNPAEGSNNGLNGLFSNIMGEFGLPFNEREDSINHVFSSLINLCKANGVDSSDLEEQFRCEMEKQRNCWGRANGEKLDKIAYLLVARLENRPTHRANGKIDSDFTQGYVGDCWLLAGIQSIANNRTARRTLNNCLKVAPNGDITVTLKGVNRQYTVSKAELNRYRELSAGDLDVRAIEIAVNKYFQEAYQSGQESVPDIHGNTINKAFDILLGPGIAQTTENIDDNIFRQIQNGNYLALTACGQNTRGVAHNSNGEERELFANHAYSIIGTQNNYVLIKNPGTGEVLQIPRNTFTQIFQGACIFDTTKL